MEKLHQIWTYKNSHKFFVDYNSMFGVRRFGLNAITVLQCLSHCKDTQSRLNCNSQWSANLSARTSLQISAKSGAQDVLDVVAYENCYYNSLLNDFQETIKLLVLIMLTLISQLSPPWRINICANTRHTSEFLKGSIIYLNKQCISTGEGAVLICTLYGQWNICYIQIFAMATFRVNIEKEQK